MDQHKMGRLAEFLQDKLHTNFLPGFYFSVGDVQDLMDEFEKQSKEPEEDQAVYYLDRRYGCIRKNLYTTFLAPEMYVEVRVDDSRKGMYVYTYEAKGMERLQWHFSNAELTQAKVDFWTQERLFLNSHNYPRVSPSERVLYVGQEDFDMMLMEG